MDGKKPNWFRAGGAAAGGSGSSRNGSSGAGPSGAGPSGAGPSGAGPSGAGRRDGGPSGRPGVARLGGRRSRSPSFLNPHGDDDSLHDGYHENILPQIQYRFANGPDLLDWIDGHASPAESIHFNLGDDNADSESGSSDNEYQRNVHERASQRNQNMPADGRPNFNLAPPCMGYGGYYFPIGCIYSAGFAAGFMSAQMRQNENYNVFHYMGFPINFFVTPIRLNPMMNLNVIRSASAAVAWRLAGGFTGMSSEGGVECGAGSGSGSTASGAGPGSTASGAKGQKPVAPNHINNAGLKRYVTITNMAYKYSNGELLNQMLSIRDVHIHDISDVTDYGGMIEKISENPHLTEAMINHIECLKALLRRNNHMALIKQICFVNAVMRLLNKPYVQRQPWTFEVMQTIAFDLRIICAKLAAPNCSGVAILQFDWIRNVVICTIHPSDCQCNIAKLLYFDYADPEPFRF